LTLNDLGGLLKCSDPRDRIFAVLALTCDAEELGLKADYSKTYEELLLDVTIREIISQNPIRFYPLACWNESNLSDTLSLPSGKPLPSWVARWSDDPNRYWTLQATCMETGGASGNWKTSVKFSSDNTELIISGLTIGYITQILVILDNDLDRAMDDKQLSIFQTVIEDLRFWLRHNPDCEMIIFLTFMHNLSYTVSKEFVTSSLRNLEDLLALGRRCIAEQQLDKVLLIELIDQLPLEHQEGLESLIHVSSVTGACIGLLDQGRICLAPRHTKIGDVLVLFSGGTTIYVIGPVNDSKFQFVGDAWSYGSMDGEQVTKPGWEDGISEFHII
jgi:hypothetical protein